MLPIRDHNPSERFPIVTVLLIAANVLVFILEMTSVDLDAFIARWALISSTMDASRPTTLLPLLTSQFLHGGIVHILGNMWYLWIFGDNVEGRLGRARFLAFYLVAGIVAALAHVVIEGVSDVPLLGASGAIAGVLGMYLALYPRHRIDALVPVGLGFWRHATLPAWIVLVFWFIIQLFSGTASLAAATDGGGVAFFAHAGGFAFGWLTAQLLKKNPKMEFHHS